MSDVLKVKVGLELDAIDSGKELNKEIEKIDLKPISVGLKLDKSKIDLSALDKLDFSDVKNRFRDIFEIDSSVIRNLRDSMNSIERVLNTDLNVKNIALFNQFSEALTNLGKSFNIDSKSLSQFEKVNSTLVEFNKLSKEAQKSLLGKTSTKQFTGNIDDISNEVDKKFGVSANQLAKSIEEGSRKLEKSFNDLANSQVKSATRYLDVQDGISQVIKKKWNDWTDLTTTTFTDGTHLGKLTSNVEGYLNKMEKQYKTVSDNIRKYSIELHKAMSEGELGSIAHYESIIKDFENLKKKMANDVEVSPFADKIISEFSRIDDLNKRIQDFSTSQYDIGVLEKQQKQYLEKIEVFAN